MKADCQGLNGIHLFFNRDVHRSLPSLSKKLTRLTKSVHIQRESFNYNQAR